MIDADALAMLPEGAVVINAARGSLLDYDALFDALESGRLAGRASTCTRPSRSRAIRAYSPRRT